MTPTILSILRVVGRFGPEGSVLEPGLRRCDTSVTPVWGPDVSSTGV